MWDKDDHTARWIQGICGAFLFFVFILQLILFVRSPTFGIWLLFTYGTLGLGTGYLSYRCLRYAITGKGCVNRDGY